MNIPALLFIVFVVPVAVAAVSYKYLDNRLRGAAFAGAVSATLYMLLMVYVGSVELYLDWELQKHDLNGDGMFSGKELTEDQALAMNKVVDDTGRTFAPFTGAIFCFFYFYVVWLTWHLIRWMLVVYRKIHITRALQSDA